MNTIFERYPKTTLWMIILLLIIGALCLSESLARYFGLGKTILYQAHPLYGYRPYPNQKLIKKQHLIKINNLGLRADQDWDPTQTQNKILFLGDSVTYGGSYISNQDLFSSIAIKDLPHSISGNAGVNGWGVDNVVAFIKDQAFLPADIYVCTFPEGDFYRGMTRIGGQPFWNRQPHFALEELLQYGVYQLHLKKFPKLHENIYKESEKVKIAETAVRHLKELSDYLHANHKTFYIYISPTLPQILGEEDLDPLLTTLFAKYDLPVIYIKNQLPPLNTAEKSVLYHDVIHLSPVGHRLWGEIMAQNLKKNV